MACALPRTPSALRKIWTRASHSTPYFGQPTRSNRPDRCTPEPRWSHVPRDSVAAGTSGSAQTSPAIYVSRFLTTSTAVAVRTVAMAVRYRSAHQGGRAAAVSSHGSAVDASIPPSSRNCVAIVKGIHG